MNKIHIRIIRIRSWLANKLIKLAFIIRPKEEKHLLNMIEDSMIYGCGFSRIKPEDMFR